MGCTFFPKKLFEFFKAHNYFLNLNKTFILPNLKINVYLLQKAKEIREIIIIIIFIDSRTIYA